MARRYDQRTTTFSPEGRLYQTEYAMEAITNAGAAAGVLTKEGIVLVGVQLTTNPLLEQASEKLFQINGQTVAVVAGITSDAINLVDYARRASLDHAIRFDENIPLEQLTFILCDLKQSYTQTGGLRPYGVSFILGGWDEHYGFQLYLTGPSGNYGGYKATAIGKNSQTSLSCLRQEYKDDITLEQGKVLALKAIAKSMDTANVNAEKLEFAVITHDPARKKGKQVVYKVLTKEEIQTLIDEHKDELVRRDDEEEEDEAN